MARPAMASSSCRTLGFYARVWSMIATVTVTAQAHVFSARDNHWLPSPAVNTEVGDVHWAGSSRSLEMLERFVERAGGSMFWSGHHGYVLQLDESTREFSTFTLPLAPDEYTNSMIYPRYNRQNLRVVGRGTAGAVRIIRIVDAGDLEVFTRANGARECVAERRVDLCQLANMKVRPHWGCFFDTAVPADLALVSFSSSGNIMFSFNVETLKLERANNNKWTFHAQRLFPYELPWPQNISSSL